MTSRVSGDLLVQQISEDEQRATPRIEKSPIILTAHRDLWALIGMLIVALFLLFLIAVVRI